VPLGVGDLYGRSVGVASTGGDDLDRAMSFGGNTQHRARRGRLTDDQEKGRYQAKHEPGLRVLHHHRRGYSLTETAVNRAGR
jgi:hypothetical protein